jgi:outer membrane protein assembly factor BamB
MFRRALIVPAALLVSSVLIGAPQANAATNSNWSAYLHGPRHSSDAPDSVAITTSNTAELSAAWTFTPTAKTGTTNTFNASPVTYNGTVYIGAGTGDFYAVNEATGQVRWRKVLAPNSGCNSRGVVSTATVAIDPVSGALTIYVAAADHFLYALDPKTGATRWRSLVGGTTSFFNWASPTVVGGKIYQVVSSDCETFTKPAGVAKYDQHTGAKLAAYTTAPGQSSGIPNVYTSALADTAGNVYITTGDGLHGDSMALVRLRAGDLSRQGGWPLPNPGDNSDFNASPAFFTSAAGTMVGACNKDGVYYAFRANAIGAGPVWSRRLGISYATQPNQLRFCGGSSAFDSSSGSLLVGANQSSLTSTILGSAYSLNPNTGAVRWRTGLPNGPVIGSVSVNGAGVVAAPTYNAGSTSGAVYLLSESTGAVLRTITTGAPVFAQPTFSDSYLLVAAGSHLMAYRP